MFFLVPGVPQLGILLLLVPWYSGTFAVIPRNLQSMVQYTKSKTPKLFIISEGSHHSLDSSPSVVGSSSSKIGLLLFGLFRKISGVISGPIAGMGGCSA